MDGMNIPGSTTSLADESHDFPGHKLNDVISAQCWKLLVIIYLHWTQESQGIPGVLGENWIEMRPGMFLNWKVADFAYTGVM